jgi:hypothetical protein
MKLGIAVVYLVGKENEKLLDLHLGQIERHTQVPYTIYGSVNRLLPQFRRKLENHPKVRLCECPMTDLRGAEEHSFYLEHLVRTAIKDGSSHVVTLHVDSFPIRRGWAEELAEKLSGSRVFATPCYRAFTACLFFHQDFYLKYQPTFLLSDADRSSERYREFCRAFNHIPDSGIGYCFKAFSEGISWYPLEESCEGDPRFAFFSTIYGDLVFHLSSAAYSENGRSAKNAVILKESSFLPIRKIGDATRFLIPDAAREWARNQLGIPISGMFLKAVFQYSRKQQRDAGEIGVRIFKKAMGWLWNQLGASIFSKVAFESVKRQLLEDPESYLNYLRARKRSKSN